MAEGARISGARRAKDKFARLLVSTGGMLIILSILGILVFLVAEVVPLWRGATAAVVATAPSPPAARVLTVDPEQRLVFTLAEDGRVVALARGRERAEVVGEARLWPAGSATRARTFASAPDGALLAAGTTDGRVLLVRCGVRAPGRTAAAVPEATFQVLPELVVDPESRPLDALAVQETPKGLVIAALLAGTELRVVARVVERNEMTEEETVTEWKRSLRAPFPVATLAVDHEARDLYAGCNDGHLCWWRMQGPGADPAPQVQTVGSSGIAALTLLLGDRTLVVGDRDGSLSAWQQVRQGEGTAFRLQRIREFPRLGAAVAGIARSLRNKALVAVDAAGSVGVYYGTTGSQRALLEKVLAAPAAVCFSPKGDGAFVLGAGSLLEIALDDPHPEATLPAMFTSVWYEGADAPSLTWQSTGGTDDFEIKLSVIPLIVGTLKGTLFSLLLAVPLAVLGAMYVAHFMHPDLKRTIKPVIEIMAALPSVVLGFLAAMWLAPRVESSFCALLLAPVVLPAAVLLTGHLGSKLPKALLGRFRPGTEALAFAVVLALGMALCIALAGPFESAVFGGDFPKWVKEHLGVVYEQRNAVVIGLAMSFAVIPIIFSIAEDAFANVPRGLVSGSLALGATRWQTVTRVVLPTASPGIFSAIMVGFGRAVGETMIVLMATGNTAILDLSPFNGFRTLSANIAVEIPEAPQGGTLYRVLFFAGLLLFAFTFFANTIAELVRQRLRVRYAGL